MTNSPKVILLCGLPGSGKSTYASSKEFKNHVRLSSDDYIESIASISKKSYNEVFSQTIKQSNKLFFQGVKYFSETNYDVLIDRINLTKSSRRKLIKKFINHMPIIVFFNVNFDTILKRNTRCGKIFPEQLLREMYERLEPPTNLEASLVTIQ
jgi:tRNA uridine 5-carbamoylmethylation protein Kti12